MTSAAQLAYAGGICSALLATGVLLQARRSIPRWTFALGLIVLAVEEFCSARAAGVSTPTGLLYWQQWRIVVASFLPGVWLLFTLTYARGNARDFLLRWRNLLGVAFVLPPVLSLLYRTGLAFLVPAPGGESEIQLRLGTPGLLVHGCLLAASVLVLVNLERTFAASVGTMRWRIKFMLMAVAVLFTVRFYTCSQTLLFWEIDPSLERLNSVALILAAVLSLRSLFRSGHFDLDIYPSHSVIQNSFTILLVGAYLFIVGVFARLVSLAGGHTSFALKAFIVLVSLIVLALLLQSDRVRLMVRRFISRHFQRPLYDYRTLWRRFTEGTASRVEQTDLSRSLVRLVADTFQTLSVSLWLVDHKKESLVLAASTVLAEKPGHTNQIFHADAAGVLDYFRLHPEPVDFETPSADWAVRLREWHPSEFRHGGHRVCVPLTGRDAVLGLLTLGDRVGGVDFSLQDFEMLKCVGDHAAASVLNVHLSQRLLQAKELESFQTMAAFFVHDLKNATSTLGLMLQNLPVHFDDPVFRQDALRGIGKTVNHINHLIGRLSLLRHDQKFQLVDASLNEVVRQATTMLPETTARKLALSLGSVPDVPLDRSQLLKVVTNLFLNANEAMPGEGEISVKTEQTGDRVVLSVQDHGCGMSPEFLHHSLFRPFQTTKKGGLGIGMFQSKMIVEAHHGRIAVASEPGKGTTFRVILPISPPAHKN